MAIAGKFNPLKIMLNMSEKIKIGTVGLGLMGSSIVTCLLAAGHEVVSLIRDLKKAPAVKERINKFLEQLNEEGLLKESPSVIIEKI